MVTAAVLAPQNSGTRCVFGVRQHVKSDTLQRPPDDISAAPAACPTPHVCTVNCAPVHRYHLFSFVVDKSVGKLSKGGWQRRYPGLTVW